MIKLGSIAVLATILALGLLMPATGNANTVSPVADAYVDSLHPNTNFGAFTGLYVRAFSPTNDYRHSFLRFDINVPSGSAVATADLFLHVRSNTATSTDAVYYVPDNNWTEGTITWNNALALPIGSLMDTEPIAKVTTTPGVWVDFDLLAHGASLGDGFLSIMIRMANEPTTGLTTFDSNNINDPNLRPYLEYTLVQHAPVPPTVFLFAGGLLGLAGIRRLRKS